MKPVKPTAEALVALDHRWRVGNLLLAPHRLGFFLAMVVLIASGAWWVLVQLDRVSVTVALPYTFSPTLAHAAVMTYGFVPLFFSGFLFTAGPKWLGVEPLATRILIAPALMQAVGWLLWIAGIHLQLLPALFGLALAWSGLTSMTWLLAVTGVIPLDITHAASHNSARLYPFCAKVSGAAKPKAGASGLAKSKASNRPAKVDGLDAGFIP